MSKTSSRGKSWEKVREQVLLRDNYICQYCRNAQATEADHIIPTSKGGTDDPSNLLAACKPCNGKKSNKSMIRRTWINPKYARVLGTP